MFGRLSLAAGPGERGSARARALLPPHVRTLLPSPILLLLLLTAPGVGTGAARGGCFHAVLGRVRGRLCQGAGCGEERCSVRGCPAQRPSVGPAQEGPVFSGRAGADAGQKQEAARHPTPIATDAVLSPFAGLSVLGANGLSAKRVPSGPRCGSGRGLGLGSRSRVLGAVVKACGSSHIAGGGLGARQAAGPEGWL